MAASLVVIDVQQEYFTGALPIAHPDRQEVLERIVVAMRAATAAGVPVVVVEHAESDASSPVFRVGTPQQELHHVIAAEHRDHLVRKSYPGSFTGTDLAEWLDGRGVDQLVICGFMTHMCCDTTTRQAAHRDTPVVVLADATGTIDLAAADGTVIPARQVHETTLAVLASGFAELVDTETWVASLT